MRDFRSRTAPMPPVRRSPMANTCSPFSGRGASTPTTWTATCSGRWTSGRAGLQAIRLSGARGDIAETDAILWQLDRDTPYVPSPLLYDDALYVIKSNDGILSVFDPVTGTPHYQRQRLDGVPNIFASPVGAAGRVYIAGRDGTTLVIAHGPRYEVLASNTLDDGFDASPAVVGDELYLRGAKFLYKIAEP